MIRHKSGKEEKEEISDIPCDLNQLRAKTANHQETKTIKNMTEPNFVI